MSKEDKKLDLYVFTRSIPMKHYWAQVLYLIYTKTKNKKTNQTNKQTNQKKNNNKKTKKNKTKNKIYIIKKALSVCLCVSL